MEIALQTYYILLPIVATAVVGWAGHVIKAQRKADTARDRGIMMVLRYMLQRYHSEYMMQGKITYAQYKNWIDFFSTYKALGGNSVAVEWDKDIQEIEKTDSISDASLYEKMLRERFKNSDTNTEK